MKGKSSHMRYLNESRASKMRENIGTSLGERSLVLRVLSATFILSKNSRVLDAKSRQKSANLG